MTWCMKDRELAEYLLCSREILRTVMLQKLLCCVAYVMVLLRNFLDSAFLEWWYCYTGIPEIADTTSFKEI